MKAFLNTLLRMCYQINTYESFLKSYEDIIHTYQYFSKYRKISYIFVNIF